jgi:hypothetical protein
MESILETKAATILQFVHGLRGSLHVTFEEGTCAHWLHDLLKPHVSRILVCDPRKNALLKAGNKNDRIDARKLADLLRSGLLSPVYHGENGIRTLKELARSYLAVTQDLTRVMNRLKALIEVGRFLVPVSGSTRCIIAAIGWTRSANRVYVSGRNSAINNSMPYDPCIARCGTICWRKAGSTLR